MKNLIIPMGGKSSRFPGMRPKWMLTHPTSGNFMCIEAIRGINLDSFDKIFFILLRDHEEKYQASVGINRSLKKMSNYNDLKERIEIIYLESDTASQSETVYRAIMERDINGFIYIKDSDGYFMTSVDSTDNQLTYFDINNIDEINARSKSYIEVNSNGIITNIVEKKVISPMCSAGGYGFSSAKEFCDYYVKIKNYPGECYISNVILEMILDGIRFKAIESTDYIDWGTLKSWNDYKSSIYTVFSDLDGTLITNTSHLVPPFIGEGIPLENNIGTLRRIKDNGGFIVITTSRPEEYRNKTIDELVKYGIPHDVLIMGLPHSRRVVINDFSESNPYPSCSSINIRRNTDSIDQYIKIQ